MTNLQKRGNLYDKIKKSKNKNEYIFHDNYVEIITNNKNKSFIIDSDDFEKVKNYCWHINNTGYVMTNNNNKRYLLHRIIFPDVPKGMQIDHINRIKTDNRKINLRIVYPFQNCQNVAVSKKSRTGIKGVIIRNNKFLASFRYNKIYYRVGLFDSINDAKIALLKKKKEIMEDFDIYENNNSI